jgi:hypothetical protein
MPGLTMTNETIFLIVNIAVLPGWALLLLAPKWRWTQRVAMVTIPVLLALAYIALFIANFNGLHLNFKSLGAVEYAFQNPGAVLAGWVHFLAFDLFVGAWIVRDARRLKIVHLAVIPCLLVTFLMGPVGLLIYLILRTGLRRGAETRD